MLGFTNVFPQFVICLEILFILFFEGIGFLNSYAIKSMKFAFLASDFMACFERAFHYYHDFITFTFSFYTFMVLLVFTVTVLIHPELLFLQILLNGYLATIKSFTK